MGTILEWYPPHGLKVHWRPSPEGNPETTWEARFVEIGPETTRLELDHWGWELYGDEADQAQSEYQTGWDHVLGRFIAVASVAEPT